MPQFDLSMLLSGQYHQWLVSGFFLSIKLSLLAFVLALPLAIVVALLRLAPAAPLRAIGQTYVEAIRNVPLLAHSRWFHRRTMQYHHLLPLLPLLLLLLL